MKKRPHTPFLQLRREVVKRNCERMARKTSAAGIGLRPHLKTAKSIEVAKLATAGHFGGITVSTLREAEYFLDRGINDITYAVGITPEKLETVRDLTTGGGRVHVLTDNVENAENLVQLANEWNQDFSVYIEVDTGYRRSGVDSESNELLRLGSIFGDSDRFELKGVLTHAGHSYDADSVEGIKKIAEEERRLTCLAAQRLRTAGVHCPEVSIGSTPTVVHGKNFDGVTEVRPGNYMFFDLSMHARGVCDLDDLAISVSTCVVASNANTGRVLVDAGALALSKDTGGGDTQHFGVVCDERGTPLDPPVVVERVCQEQGWLSSVDGFNNRTSEFPVGRKLCVLPNHSCMTTAAYNNYHVINEHGDVVDKWERCGGW